MLTIKGCLTQIVGTIPAQEGHNRVDVCAEHICTQGSKGHAAEPHASPKLDCLLSLEPVSRKISPP